MNVFADTMVLTGRMMKHMTRSVDTIMTVVLMPIMLMLAFIYIFGGAMTIPQETYKGFIVPAILLFTVASGVGYTAFRLNTDVQIGILFISSGFVPTETLPKVLRGFADYQPMTPIINSLRSILTDGKIPADIWGAFVWSIGAIVIFQVLSIYVYRKKLR